MVASLADLQQQHPEWNLVDAVDAPGGGVWALGADGGVFALDGAPFFGSAAGQDFFRNRTATRIELEPNGGYRLFSQAGEEYNFEGPGPYVAPPLPAAPPPEPAGPDVEETSAKAIIASTLKQFNLSYSPEEADRLFRAFLTGGETQFFTDLRGSTQYKARFPGMEALSKKGRAIDESTYIAYEKTATGLMRQAGLPAGFYDQPEDFGTLVGGEVSAAELADRVQLASQAAMGADPQLRAQLASIYKIDQGSLAAFFLDPDKALPVIQRQFLAAEGGFGAITADEAQRLGVGGASAAQLQERFGALAQAKELTQALPGEAEQGLTREQQLGFAAGGTAEQQALEQKARKRKAAFEVGGGFAGGQEGISGLAGS